MERRNIIETIYKIPSAERFKIKELVPYRKGQIISLSLLNKNNAEIIVFSFDEGEGISEQTSFGDIMYCILDGRADIYLKKKKFSLSEGDAIVIEAGESHSINAITYCKMLQILISK